MKHSIQLALSGILLCSPSLFGMMIAPEEVHIKNNLNRRLKITWQNPANEPLNKVIQAGDKRIIDVFNNIAPGSHIKIEPYGTLFGWTAQALEIKRTLLNAEFNELNPQANDSLEVVISQGYSTSLTPTYQIYVPLAVAPAEQEPIDIFTGLLYHTELDNLKEADITGFKSYKTLVIPGSLTSGETKALDVYRYMFDLPPDYSVKYVKKVFKEFAREWHPDRGTHGKTKEFAARVFNLARLAYQGLLDARDPMFGVVIVDKEEEPGEPGPIVIVEDSDEE